MKLLIVFATTIFLAALSALPAAADVYAVGNTTTGSVIVRGNMGGAEADAIPPLVSQQPGAWTNLLADDERGWGVVVCVMHAKGWFFGQISGQPSEAEALSGANFIADRFVALTPGAVNIGVCAPAWNNQGQAVSIGPTAATTALAAVAPKPALAGPPKPAPRTVSQTPPTPGRTVGQGKLGQTPIGSTPAPILSSRSTPPPPPPVQTPPAAGKAEICLNGKVLGAATLPCTGRAKKGGAGQATPGGKSGGTPGADPKTGAAHRVVLLGDIAHGRVILRGNYRDSRLEAEAHARRMGGEWRTYIDDERQGWGHVSCVRIGNTYWFSAVSGMASQKDAIDTTQAAAKAFAARTTGELVFLCGPSWQNRGQRLTFGGEGGVLTPQGGP